MSVARSDPGTHGQRGISLGISLVEMLVAVALLAILVGLTVPAYQRYAMRVYRAAAIELMLDAAHCQEQLRATAFRYDTTRCHRVDASGRYELRYEPPDTADTLQFEVIATPLGGQDADRCGTLGLDQSGQRSATGAQGSTACWSGR